MGNGGGGDGIGGDNVGGGCFDGGDAGVDYDHGDGGGWANGGCGVDDDIVGNDDEMLTTYQSKTLFFSDSINVKEDYIMKKKTKKLIHQ